MEGTWQARTAKGAIYEEWKAGNANNMHGRSYKVNGSDTITLETVQLLEQENKLYYIPTVNGQNNNQPVRFNLTSNADRTFIFENPAHDFPQRIIYKLIHADSMVAWIDGNINGKRKSVEFGYKRVK
jgi:hypothetical protein